MYNRAWVIGGIILFVIVATFPFWLGIGKKATALKLEMPSEAKACIEPTEFMRSEHMRLLDTWRNAVVRHGDLIYTATDGREYKMSLHDTCMGCHTSKAAFCERCHDYAGVTLTCWECHVAPEETKEKGP